MTIQEAVQLYRSEREKRGSEALPGSWTLTQLSRKTQYPLGNGAFLTHIEPAE